jgi:hypothetical protein
MVYERFSAALVTASMMALIGRPSRVTAFGVPPWKSSELCVKGTCRTPNIVIQPEPKTDRTPRTNHLIRYTSGHGRDASRST